MLNICFPEIKAGATLFMDIKKFTGYDDLYFRLIASLLGAHFIVSFGERESFFELLLLWYYYRALLISFLIGFTLFTLINSISTKLDRQADWRLNTTLRTALQILFGLVLPGIVAFLLACLYFSLCGLNIFHTLYLKYDFPVIVLLLLLINAYYLVYYFVRKPSGDEPSDTVEQEAYKEIMLVSKGSQNIPIQTSQIAYYFRDGDYNFLRTIDGEDFVINQTLDELQQSHRPQHFFRANRQLLVHVQACAQFDLLEYGKLQLHVNPPFKEALIVSRERATNFRNWIRQRK